MRRNVKWLLLLCPLLMAHGACGPTNTEAGLAALFSLPLVLIGGGAVLWTLWLTWSRRWPDGPMPARWRGWRNLLIGSAIAAALGLFHPEGLDAVEWAP